MHVTAPLAHSTRWVGPALFQHPAFFFHEDVVLIAFP
jgi:hypothetical protein